MTSLSNNPSATEHKYSILRKRLDQMGYHHPLGLESVYLVERLFGDLIHTTESLKHEKSRSLQPQDDAAFEEYIKSYKTENAKLIRENNQLHQQLLAKQEKTENNVKGLKRSLQKLECENADLRFLNTQYLQRIKYLEEESQAKSDKIMQLQEKNLQAVVQTPGGKKRNIAFRRQKMEIEEMLLPRYLLYSPKKIEQPTDVYNTDMMSIADRRISQLEEEAQCIKKKQQETDKVCEYQQKQLEMRDKEINRLTKLLEGGRPLDAIRVEVKNQETEKHIAHLEMQVEYLQQENQELQEKCEDIGEVKKSLAHSVSSRGSPSLEDYTKSPRRLPHDNTMAEKEDIMKKRKEKSEIDKLKEELNQVNSIRKDLKKESQDLKILLEDKNQEQQKLEEVIHKLQEEIQTLSIRVNELQKNEKELVLEIDRLNSLKPSPEKEPSSRPSSSILLLVDALESERDHFKEEALALAQRLQSLKAGNSFFSLEKQTEETSSSQQTHDKMIKLLEDERDYYRQLYQQQLEDSHSIGRQAPSGSPTTTEKGVSTVNNDTGEVLEERDKLQKMLTQHKEELEELKYTIKVLKQDKEKAVNLYKQAKQEALNLQDELVKSAKSPNQSLASEAVIRRLEEEKKQNWYKYQQAQEEMDRLKDKLQVLEEDHQIEKKTLQKEIDQFKSHIKELEKQNSEHESSISSYKALLTTMNVQITSLESKLSKTEEQANQQKTAAAQMRVLVEQAEQSLEMLHKKLATKDEESHHTGQQFKELQKEIDNLNSLIEEQKNEQTRLRSTVAALDREKDQIQSEADSKAEHLVEAHQTLNKKDKELKDTKKTILMMEQQADI
ncbi:uncharacterized protein LOC143247486 isoform X2 [Tachypleus tridentatus]|uniref:uncharacterized protein LOC143247486 isoform X2 n=1 Tax=Tachypleus tridentatus TaxID=6853 RepID=UPI003FCF6D7F